MTNAAAFVIRHSSFVIPSSFVHSSFPMNDLLIHVSRRAMACEFEVRFPAEQYPQGTEFALESLDLVEALEEQISYFRPTSELSRAQPLGGRTARRTGAAAVRSAQPGNDLVRGDRRGVRRYVGSALGGMGVCPAERPGPFAGPTGRGPVVRGRPSGGTGRRAADGPLPTAGRADQPRQHRQGIRPGPLRRATAGLGAGRLPAPRRPEQRAWPGGQAAFCKHPEGRPECLPHLSKPWEIGIRHPRQPGRRLGVVRLHDRALGTSGGQFQSFRHRGRRYGHILDPRSGWPAEGVLVDDGRGPHGRPGRCPLDGLLRHGTRPLAGLLPDPSGNWRGLDLAGPHGEDVEIHTAGLDEEELVIHN